MSRRVGVPIEGERKCPRCRGVGRTAADVARASHTCMAGCDRCEGTGVVPQLRVGDQEPVPKRKLVIRPNAPIDNRPSFQPSRGPSPKGVFK